MSATFSLTEFFGPPVHIYSRRQAIEDGVLIDVTDLARDAGFVVPAAITSAVEILVTPTGLECDEWGERRTGRLWDVLWMARFYAAQNREESEFLFPVIMQFAGRANPRRTVGEQRCGQRQITLKCVIGPGDAGEPVITIMMPEES